MRRLQAAVEHVRLDTVYADVVGGLVRTGNHDMSDTIPTAPPNKPTSPDGYTQWSFWILAATILLLGVTVLVQALTGHTVAVQVIVGLALMAALLTFLPLMAAPAVLARPRGHPNRIDPLASMASAMRELFPGAIVSRSGRTSRHKSPGAAKTGALS